ncbi:cupin domain-containing protein [Nocardia aurea]|uniref:cupin domain-containing protein n=1 Tax=Nocardia aurea TaxID=2144174 RepID=UPI000D693937|nr:cupin domain-containing protein [Nocardia aurea]
MEFVRRFAPDSLKPDVFDHRPLADLESCLIEGVRAPEGSTGFPRHKHPESDQLFFILEGCMQLELDGEQHAVPAGSTVFIPAGTPHRNHYPHPGTELHLDVLLPPPARGLPLAEAADEDESGGPGTHYVLPPSDDLGIEIVPGFHVRDLAHSGSGSSYASMRLAHVDPGNDALPWHIHEFDQLYFVLDGTLEVEVANHRHRATRFDLVVLPAGVPHRNRNPGPGRESHLVLLVPEPAPGVPPDLGVDFRLNGHSFG